MIQLFSSARFCKPFRLPQFYTFLYIEKDQYRKIAPRKFHDLRHTYATRLFQLGEKPKTVQELLGHSDTSVTLGTYTHVLESMKVIAASKLDDLYMSMQTD